MRNMFFAQLSIDQRVERIERIIRIRTNDLLSTENIQCIADAIDNDQQYGIEVVYNPDDFERLLTLQKTQTKRTDGHIESRLMKGTGIFGSFSFGEDTRTVDEIGNRAVGKILRGKLYQPAMPAAAVISVTNSGYADLKTPLMEDKIIIYIPLPLFREAG